MDIGIVAGVALLIVWAVGTFVFMAPGWIHLLLTLGVFIVIWRIVVLGTAERRGSSGKSHTKPQKPVQNGSRG
ncbi:MAG TPA: DUF5670 family protein [Gemmatimonadaceae bacterium]